MNDKTCSQCLVTKDISLFAKAVTCVGGFRTNCKACQKIKKDEWRHNNQEHHRLQCRAWVKANPEKRKEIVLASRTLFGSRKKKVRQATPSWANGFYISEIYHLARLRTKLLGITYHVDHVIPIKGKLVCGLHVEDNLRIIPADLNMKKGNDYSII